MDTPDSGRQQPPVPAGTISRAELALELGISVHALRRREMSLGIAGQRLRAPGGSTVAVFTDEEADVLRRAVADTWRSQHVAIPASTASGKAPAAASDRERSIAPAASGHDLAPGADDDGARDLAAVADGWRQALDESRAVASQLRTDLDRALSERDVARVERDAALRRATEAERGQSVATERVAGLVAAWWRWRLQLETLGAIGRWRKRWPADPPEIAQPPLIEGPRG